MSMYACKERNTISTSISRHYLHHVNINLRHTNTLHTDKITTRWQQAQQCRTRPKCSYEQQHKQWISPLNCALPLFHGQISTDSPATFTAEVGKRSAQARAHVREDKETKWKRIAHSNRWDPDTKWMQNLAVTPSLSLTGARRLHSPIPLCWPPTVVDSTLR
jgi:hypothetical protein